MNRPTMTIDILNRVITQYEKYDNPEKYEQRINFWRQWKKEIITNPELKHLI